VAKPSARYIRLFSVLLTLTFGGFFVYRALLYLEAQDPPATAPSIAPVNLDRKAAINVGMLNDLDWQNVDAMTKHVGTDSDKINQLLYLTSDMQNPAALYLRGFVLMINEKPLQALQVFDQLNLNNMPAHFLYPAYRLHRQLQPGSTNRYLDALKRAIENRNASPLIAARVESQEGDLYSALSNYLQTDPAQWATYDVKCIKKIGQHSGLSSEMRRMVFGALKSGRVSGKVEKPLRQLLDLKNDSAEVKTLKRTLQKELLLDSSTGKIAVSSIKRMLDTRAFFLQRDYQKIINHHQDTNPLALPNESVLILFLCGVKLEDRLEIDRWGQEIKRRYPNQEVVDWVSELTNSVK